VNLSPPARLGLRSLRVQLWLWIALPATIGLLALALVELYGHERAMHRLVAARAQDQAQAVAALIDAQVVRRQEQLAELAHSLEIDGVLPDSSPYSGGLALYGAQDQALTANVAWAADPEAMALVQRVRAGSTGVPSTVLALDNGSALLLLATAGHEERVLVGAVPIGALVDASMARVAPLDIPGQLTLMGGSDIIAQVGQVERTAQVARGEAAVMTTGWHVILIQPWAMMRSPLLRIGNTVGAVVMIAVAISGLAAFFGLRYVVQPLRRLNTAAVTAGWGDDALLQQPVAGVAEIDELRLALVRMTAQVRRYQQQLHSYIDAMTLGQEEERKRLARDLHDETVQALIALNQQIELAEREIGKSPASAAQRLQTLRPLVTDTVAGLRRQIQALRPLYLEDLGFVAALEMLVRETAQPAGIIGDFEATGEAPPALSPALEITAFRIVQEALHNVVAHAQASWVHVEVRFERNGIALRVEDDGVGFDVPTHPFSLAQQGHLGLLGMYERTQAHGGRLQVQSDTGKGTTVDAWLPLPDASPPRAGQAISERADAAQARGANRSNSAA
jgi:signal transduction histidine kinase